MNSSYIKVALSHYYRFANCCKIMATEAGRYNADFLVIKNNVVTECEIKTSRTDLNADFRKNKHRVYASDSSYWTPNQFYFAVPEELVEYAVSKCVDKKYGVLSIREVSGTKKSKYYANDYDGAVKRANYLTNRYPEFELLEISEDKSGFYALLEREEYFPWKNRVRVVKRARTIHNRPPDKRVVDTIIARLSSEMANLRASEYSLKESIKGKK